MKMNLPRAAQYAMRALTHAGYQAYIVGGSVRDVLLGKEPDDYDITTSATPDEVMDLFRRDKLVLNGLKHGTVRLIKYATPIEITAFRADGGDQEEAIGMGGLYEDVQQRDITINALCWNEKAGLIDYAGGVEDLEAHLIRSLGEPNAHFREDGIRILRALRFSAVLDFDIDPPTAQAIHSNAALLESFAPERILLELRKLVCGSRAEAVFVEYRDVFEVILPELKALSADQYLLAARRMALVAPAPELRLAALLCDLSREQVQACGLRLKFSKLTRGFIDGAIERRSEPMPTTREGMRRLMSESGAELLAGLVELRAAHIRALTHMIIQQNDCISFEQLALDSEDVFRLGVTRRGVGPCLKRLLDRVIDGELPNTREALSEAVCAELAAQAAQKPPKKPRRRRKTGAEAADTPAQPEE